MPMIGTKHGGDDAQHDHDRRDRVLRHEAAQREHADEGERVGDELQLPEETLVEAELVHHPPGRAFAGRRHAAEDEKHERRGDQYLARLGGELAREAPEEKHDDRERSR